MTQKQRELLEFLATYRLKYGTSPTLQEMVKGIQVSDHKSVSRIIGTLIKQEYLERGRQKIRGVLLTDKAFEFLRVPLFHREYPEKYILDHRQLAEFKTDSVVIASPASDFLSYGGQPIKTDGTNSRSDLRTFMKTAISEALGQLPNGTLSGLSSLNHWAHLLQEGKFIERVIWIMSLPLLTWLFISIIGFNSFVSFGASLMSIWFIKKFLTK